MKFTLKYYFLFCLFIAQSCKSQVVKSSHKFYNKDFKWTIEIPVEFQDVSDVENLRLEEKGKSIVEKSTGLKVTNYAKPIFFFKSDKFNYFEANYQPFDSTGYMTYSEQCKMVNETMYQTFKSQMPDVTMDSSSSTEMIDNLLFNSFKVRILLTKDKLLEITMYSRLFGNKEFTVNIITLDENKRIILYNSFVNSTFAKP